MDARQLSEKLARDAESVCRYLLPNGQRQGQEWRVGSVVGEKGQSLGVRLTGDKAGVWADFSAGTGGDLLDLWAACRGVSFREAYQQASDWAGVKAPAFAAMPRREYARPAKPACKKVQGSALEYLTEQRGLSLSTIDAYRIAVNASGEIVFPLLVNGDLLNAKYLKPRTADDKKNGWRQESNAEPCLFGWQAIPDDCDKVVITEGEIDALSCFDAGFPALSLPSGSKNLEWVEFEFDRLARFREIILCLDQDEPGQEATREILSRFDAHRVRVASLPLKDANEMLTAGKREELIDALKKADSIDPAELRNAGDYLAEVLAGESADQGFQLPFYASQDVMLRMAELSLWTGINGHGKSQLLGHVNVHLMAKGERVCIFSGEMKPARLLDRMIRQVLAFGHPDRAAKIAAMEWLANGLWLFDVTGNAKADRIIEVFTYARQRYGIRWFVVDSLAKCGIAEDDYRTQKAFIDRLCDLKNEHDCHVMLVVHPRKGDDEYKQPGKLDVKGTGAIADMADSIFSVWRNKRKEEKPPEHDDEPDAVLYCNKQRNGEWEGRISLAYDKACLQYLPKGQQSIQYARYDGRLN